MIRTLLVDDHQLFRETFRWRLTGDPEIDVVGEAAGAQDAWRQSDALTPDVIVLDVTLNGISGLAAALELFRRDRRRRVLFLSMHYDADTIAQAFSTGASGYAVKDQPFDAVRTAILAVARGETVLPPGVNRSDIQERLLRQNGDTAGAGPLGVLTAREKEVFGLLAQGISNNAIAGQLHISVNTVETHRAHILKKLGVHSLSDIVRVAARHGLLQHV
jgi:two-component system, NarL family, nitrate/nitrite response regulator NarL